MDRKNQRYEGPGAWLKNFLAENYGPDAVHRLHKDSLPQIDGPIQLRGPEFEFDNIPSCP